MSLERVVALGELTSGSSDAVNDVLESLLGLGGNVGDLVGGRVALLVAPVDFESVKLKDLVETVDVLGLVRRETAELSDEAHQFLDIVTRIKNQSRAH